MADVKLTSQQQAVIENSGGTLLVSAAAGSGKTKVLVDRVIDRICNSGQNINDFLIITFTNAAAAELRGKISSALGKALSQDPDNQHLRKQLTLMHLAQISTVHAFCAALIRQYGYLLQIPSDYTMLEDSQRQELLSRLLGDILEEHYANITPEFQLLADTLGAGRSDQALETLALNLLEKMLSQPFPLEWAQGLTVEFDAAQPISSTTYGQILLVDAAHKIQWLIDRHIRAIEQMHGDEKLEPKYLPAYETQLAGLKKLFSALNGSWDELNELMDIDFPRIVVRSYPDKQHLEEIQQVRKDTKKLLEALRNRFSRNEAVLIQEQNAMAPALRALRDLTVELYHRFDQIKREKSLMDFSDLEQLTIKLLLDENGKATEPARELARQYVEIMVDEYQDSNRVQEVIYTAISRNDDSNRFLVGDVKQSIYGFRQAEPELFLEKYIHFTPAEFAADKQPRKLVLSRNFRSRAEILEAVNHTFATILSKEVGQLDYGSEEQLYPGLEQYPQDGKKHVSLHVLSLPKSTGESDQEELNKYQKEAYWVAGKIAEILNKGLPIRDGDNLRAATPDDIAVLFRSRAPMTIYQRALSKAGIPIAPGAGDQLFEAQEVQVLMSLLHVLDNPHQDIPLISVLCSPLYRLSNDQLGIIRACSKAERFFDAMLQCREPWCQKVVKSLEELRQKARILSADTLVWSLISDTGLMAAYSAMSGGAARRQNLLKVYELARNAAAGGFLYLYELIRNLDRMAATGLEAASPGTGGVTLTTIHRSKGLEYPIVFLCDLSRKFNFRELNNIVLLDGKLGIGSKIIDTNKRIRYPGFVYEAIEIERRNALLAEEMRILYVAMTRPKDYLFMTYADAGIETVLKRLMCGLPNQPWAVDGAKCLGDWVLMSALGRVEAGALFELVGRPQCQLTVPEFPWDITLECLDHLLEIKYHGNTNGISTHDKDTLDSEKLTASLLWKYPHHAATIIPSKLTATQLKGRTKDTEIQENTDKKIGSPQLVRPDFILRQRELTPQEKGTATHLFLQFAKFEQLTSFNGFIQEKERLVDEEYLTEAQAEAVEPSQIITLFSSEIGQRMLKAPELIREFKFSLLTPANQFYPEVSDENVLMQGVVDAAILEKDGLTIIDFKTDRVTGQSLQSRAKHYCGQIAVYRQALERIFLRPVKQSVLYFLYAGEEVIL